MSQSELQAQSKQSNRQIVLASRPHGAPTAENFRLEQHEVLAPKAGEVLLRTVYLSLDPYMRGRMSDAESYAEPVAIGAVMLGATVSRVEQSQHPDYAVGDWVLAYSGWQDYAISDGTGLSKLGQSNASVLCPRYFGHARFYWLYGPAGYWTAQSR